MTTPLWRRPTELGRKLIGNTIQYVAKLTATASAVSVAIGNGETLEGKLSDALVVPDLLQAYHRAKYLADHQEQIQRSLEYVKTHALTPEALERLSNKAESAVQSVQSFSGHMTAIQDNVVFGNFHPTVAYDHASKVIEMLPAMPDAYRAISTASAKTAQAMHYLSELDYRPAYSALVNLADNFSRDEIGMTLGVMAGVAGSIYLAGAYIGSMWIDRGIPHWFTRQRMNFGARRNRRFYVDNLDVILGKDVYAAAKEHFKK